MIKTRKRTKRPDWMPAVDAKKVIAALIGREALRAESLGKNPKILDRLYGDTDDFDPLEHAAWEERERIKVALAILEELRTLPAREAALKLLGIFDALHSQVKGNEKKRKKGRPQRSVWDDIDAQAGLGKPHNSKGAAARADQRFRKKYSMKPLKSGRPKVRQK